MLRRGRCPASSASRISSHGDEESVKLFIGGLAWATNEASLRAAFAKYGEVTDAVVILDRETGRSRGFGFVTFAEADDGKRALAEMNGYSLDGRAIRCTEATERPGRGRPDSRGPRPSGGEPRPSGGGRSFDGGAGGGRSFRDDRGRPPTGGGGAGAGGSRGPAPSRARFDTAPPPDTDDRSKRSREKKRRVREPVGSLDDDRGSRSRAPRRRGGGGGGRPEIFKNLEDYDDDVG